MPVVARGVAGEIGERAVGLVHHDEVGELDDPALHALQLVAGARREEQQNTSTMPATATSDWPTPTVSTSTTSKPAASHTQHRFAGAAGDAAERAPSTATGG